ncbi:MAG: glycosyltransferase family 2 protein [Pseudomonadales bacterium]|nr:glycosyltransferase family 2 protein [Pseudomonadales bacterium]
MNNRPLADVIVPVYNEAECLETFYRRVKALGIELNLIFIDNNSEDDSCKIMETFEGVTLIRHKKNEGYGGSILDGIAQSGNENIIIIDADCEFPPECIPALLENLNKNAVVHASRLKNKKSAKAAGMPYMKWLGNYLISALFNMLFKQSTTDLYTGCKALKRSALDSLALKQTGFEHVLELSARLAQKGYRIQEIPVDFVPRSTGISKMQHVSELGKFLFFLVCFYLQNPKAKNEK